MRFKEPLKKLRRASKRLLRGEIRRSVLMGPEESTRNLECASNALQRKELLKRLRRSV